MNKTVIVLSYAEAEEYIKAGWKLTSIKNITLPGINKSHQEHTLTWSQKGEPVNPKLSNPQE